MHGDRRAFLGSMTAFAGSLGARLAAGPARPTQNLNPGQVMSVLGRMDPNQLGITLMHEHVLVDFVGAAHVSPDRYNPDEAFAAALPHLKALFERGCRTLVECTPAFIGRDPELLRRLSAASGLNLITNTGYYGAADDKYVPAHAYEEDASQLAARWTEEYEVGVEETGIRPGFQKIGVDSGPLSDIDRKLVEASALCHLATGLTVNVHTGDGRAAMGVIATLKAAGVSPEAYVWVHAQNEPRRELHLRAAEQGAFVEFDGIAEDRLDESVSAVNDMIRRGRLEQILVSQDAGWYHVGEPAGGLFRPYTFLFDGFLPALRQAGVSEAQTRTLLVDNPARALSVNVRRL